MAYAFHATGSRTECHRRAKRPGNKQRAKRPANCSNIIALSPICRPIASASESFIPWPGNVQVTGWPVPSCGREGGRAYGLLYGLRAGQPREHSGI